MTDPVVTAAEIVSSAQHIDDRVAQYLTPARRVQFQP
jgi:hypothetical protein